VIGSYVLNAFVTVALVVVIGHVIYGVEWPREPFTLVVFTGLGVLSFAALGIAFSQVIPNVDSAPAYSNAVFLPVIFISGVFYDTGNLPTVLNAIAEALPLKHVIDGLSAGIVGTNVDLAVAAAVTSAWANAGICLSARYFRWQ
jgi:ABC-2 type transport system permease protein